MERAKHRLEADFAAGRSSDLRLSNMHRMIKAVGERSISRRLQDRIQLRG